MVLVLIFFATEGHGTEIPWSHNFQSLQILNKIMNWKLSTNQMTLYLMQKIHKRWNAYYYMDQAVVIIGSFHFETWFYIEIWCWTSKLLSNNEKCTLQFTNSPKQFYFTTSWSCLGFHGLCKIWEMAIHGENWSFLLKRLILTTRQNLSLCNKAANNSFRVLLPSQDIVHGIKLNQLINVAHE